MNMPSLNSFVEIGIEGVLVSETNGSRINIGNNAHVVYRNHIVPDITPVLD